MFSKKNKPEDKKNKQLLTAFDRMVYFKLSQNPFMSLIL